MKRERRQGPLNGVKEWGKGWAVAYLKGGANVWQSDSVPVPKNDKNKEMERRELGTNSCQISNS